MSGSSPLLYTMLTVIVLAQHCVCIFCN